MNRKNRQMKNKMKRRAVSSANIIILILVFIFSASTGHAGVKVIKPTQQATSSFAIVIDSVSFSHTQESVMAYRDMLETENLSVYVVVSQWQRPCQVREELLKLHQGNPALEGAVFIGNIPVAMIGKAQHMTSLFRMNDEVFPRNKSSVASDRFYDDFDLKFDYKGQDEENPRWHYYDLRHDSPQHIRSDIYSGRIMPVENGTDPYQQINNYLGKVVSERTRRNRLDDIFTFLGEGTLSGCMVAWGSHKIALSQQFPQMNRPGYSFRHLSYNMIPDIKTALINELQRPLLDLALLTHHGNINMQHLNSEFPTNSFREYSHRIQSAIHNIQIRNTSRKIKERQLNHLGIPGGWLDSTDFQGEYVHPAVQEASYRMQFDEVVQLQPNARVIILSACFTGSFHHPDNIAGAYIFGSGQTQAVISNSVNVAQDVFAHQYMGLLSRGVRLGLLRQHNHSLESHIMGDPTFHFYHEEATALNRWIVENQDKPGAWRRRLKEEDADMQAFALMMTQGQNPAKYSALLLDTYLNSPWHTVRMECLVQLHRINDSNFKQILVHSASDPYEQIRRMGAIYMGQKGDPEFIPLLVSMVLHDSFYLRSSGNAARSALLLFEPQSVIAEITRQVENNHLSVGLQQHAQQLVDHLEERTEGFNTSIARATDYQLEDQERKFPIILMRINLLHHHVEKFLTLAADPGQSEMLRTLSLEALGWYTTSITRGQILECCQQIAADPRNPGPVVQEARKTILRLEN